MANEVLCKLIGHNLCCLISAMYELGIDPSFGSTTVGFGSAEAVDSKPA
jgi:hypothetical protein